MAYPFRAILSPIQFDDLSLPALGFAKSIAKDQSATVHLLHVVTMASALGEPALNATLHGRAEEKAIEALNDIAAKHLEGVSYVIHTRFASPKGLARMINEVAAEIGADLIVLKTHGRHGISHLILGSVAEEVVRSAPCAVLSLTPTASGH
jgi:nucleotide-binding universal stress UspA family protein